MRDDLRDDLLRMLDEDQAVRRTRGDTRAVDERNATRLKEIVAEYGWPGRSLVGDNGAEAAWCIAQHSPDRQFMALEPWPIEDPDGFDERAHPFA